ncbi:MAG: helix-hairpin-helix domain-containing protein [Bacteroidota bacterium]
MKRRQNLVADYFTFSKSQRNGIFIAVGLMVICAVVKFSYGFFFSSKTVPVDSAFFRKVAALKMADTNSYANNYAKNYKRYNNYDDDANYNEPSKNSGRHTIKGELFEFDPNTISTEEWKRLGVREKTIATIQNYLSKGGKFRKPEDIKRIYGLFPDEAERLLPYVKITDGGHKPYQTENATASTQESPVFSKPTYAPKTIDINTADTTVLIALPGIGSKLASRIVSFREKLGGFSSISQLGETYGLPDSTFQKIKPRLVLNSSGVKQFNINTSDANTMKMHPYIKWNIANAIVQYRTQHGNFSSLADLKKIEIIDEQTFIKIAPYLTL